jgi:outer membrane protein OmpA-like peptidoglycan-associated protein
MKKFILSFFITLAGIAPLIAQEDVEGSKDPALFTRMPGYHIYRYDDVQFDKYEFRISHEETKVVEGHHLLILYDLNNNVQAPSPLQIGRNYINAVKKIGGQLVYEYQDPGEDVVLKVIKNGMEVWAYVSANGSGSYGINLIEKQAMNQDVVADANSLANSIKESGKVAVYGIYFDSGKSVLKPASQPALQEISKLLKNDPALKLYVVGHTDNVGDYVSNMQLSIERGIAVVNELKSKYSVNEERLRACGDGPTSPVASNDKEEGRALNRRVELVKQ